MKTESEQGWETDGGALHGPSRDCGVAPAVDPLHTPTCVDRFGWTNGDTLQIRVVKSGVENARRLGMSARSCASCGNPLTLELEIHVCTDCSSKGGA